MASHENFEAQDEEPAVGGADGAEPGQQIDKIREIIFGGQMRDYEQRFAQLERELTERTARLGEELGERLAQTERAMREELRQLGDRLLSEARHRGEERETAAAALRDAESRLAGQLQSLEQQAGGEAEALREALKRNSADFHDALLTLGERVDRALAKAADELEDAKVSREDLAGLLGDVARRLRREDGQG